MPAKYSLVLAPVREALLAWLQAAVKTGKKPPASQATDGGSQVTPVKRPKSLS